MRCPACSSRATTERSDRTELGYRRYRCRDCDRGFNERSGTLFNRLQYPTDVVCLVVLWRLRYKLSLRDLVEMFALRGFVFTHEAVREWEAKLAPHVTEELRKARRGKAGKSWYTDETYLRVAGRWCYLYRAIDRTGNLVDVRLSETRDLAAAKAFFTSARIVTGITPQRVTTDGHDAYPGAIKAELGEGGHASDEPIPEQSSRAGSSRHQRPVPVHARVQERDVRTSVLPRLRRGAPLSALSFAARPATLARRPALVPSSPDQSAPHHPGASRPLIVLRQRRSDTPKSPLWRKT